MLSIEKVEAGYGESLILKGMNLSVMPGQVVCLMGRNGVGKTTLMRTIMGIVKTRGGKIMWNEQDISGLSSDRRAQLGIGYVPQGRDVFGQMTVEENLLLGLEAAKSKSKDIPEDVLDLFPILKDFLKRKGGDLSGGQQQQLAIARALVSRPKLLLLDEPMEGIQPSVVDLIESVIEGIKHKREMGVLLVEQSLEFVGRIADHYYVMEKGACVAEGGADELSDELIREHLTV
ncbi:urea ABC transporter ATP-binding subunit UrtE [Paenibacillus turpanensis]|uniref:urea ABC transporter ATP-binding subunit UrtE n=1 Tax=Paenibacillus turpanensis TaxID=2689078 RepID=UPI001407E9FF|nr:urea ABC transporter ATP-binding subunit UrtE [Paenibacillus turpanensis]